LTISLIATANTIAPKILCKRIGESFLAPKYEPTCPPKKTARAKKKVISKFKSGIPRKERERRPLAEFKKIKALVVAMASLAPAQPRNNNIGESKIPPPKPTRPASRPSNAPKGMPIKEALRQLSWYLAWIASLNVSILKETASRVKESRIENALSGIGISPPKNAAGMEESTKGKRSLAE